MPDIKEYFSDAKSWDKAYEGKGGKDFLTIIANKLFRKRLLNKRLDTVLRLMQPIEGKSVLDAGCGSGRIAFATLDARAKSVIGIDYNKNMIQLANVWVKNNKGDTRISFEINDITKYQIYTDIVLLIGVLSYNANFETILNNVLRNKHKVIILQYLPGKSTTFSAFFITSLAILWGRIRKIKVYKRHSSEEINRYMEKNGYVLKKYYEDGNGIVARFDKLNET